MTSAVLAFVLLLGLQASGTAGAPDAAGTPGKSCPLAEPGAPRVLLLALDGTPLRVVQQAKAKGVFGGWPEPVGLISTFPSMTNVAFTALLEPLGFPGTIAGYEIRRYDFERNLLHGGKKKSSVYPWKGEFHVYSDTLTSKVDLYLSPIKSSDKLLRELEEVLLDGAEPSLVFAHLPSTDMTAHLDGDEATLEVLEKVSDFLARVTVAHREAHGRDLQVILLSDHGNGAEKVSNTQGLRDALRGGGFRLGKRLDGPDDLVVALYGAVNYGALYLDPARAREAASAALTHESVELAAWVSDDGEITVLGRSGEEARVRWSGDRPARRFGYEPVEGDPLRLVPVAARLETSGALTEGLADRSTWFKATIESYYPDALARLVDSLEGRWVENPATVILSLDPRYAWGMIPTRIGASLLGGRQEGTHGGLDRDSSLAFLLVNDSGRQPGAAVAADQALEAWAHLAACSGESAR